MKCKHFALAKSAAAGRADTLVLRLLCAALWFRGCDTAAIVCRKSFFHIWLDGSGRASSVIQRRVVGSVFSVGIGNWESGIGILDSIWGLRRIENLFFGVDWESIYCKPMRELFIWQCFRFERIRELKIRRENELRAEVTLWECQESKEGLSGKEKRAIHHVIVGNLRLFWFSTFVTFRRGSSSRFLLAKRGSK